MGCSAVGRPVAEPAAAPPCAGRHANVTSPYAVVWCGDTRTDRDRSGTLNRNDYFEAGLNLLAEGGVAEQTIANLCERLGITKGSFYHHFTSLADFRQQLLAYWEAGQEAALGDGSASTADWVAPAHQPADAAARAWSQSDEAAAEVQGRIDAARLKAAAKELRNTGVSADRARSLANLGLAIQIGVQTAGASWDRKTRKALVDEFQKAVDAAATEGKKAPARKAKA